LFKRVHTLKDWFNQPFEEPAVGGRGGAGDEQQQPKGK
jgi:hypothetical protein